MSTYNREDKIRFARDCIAAGVSTEKLAHYLHVQVATLYRWLGPPVTAQHSETGRIWTGPKTCLPWNYSRIDKQ